MQNVYHAILDGHEAFNMNPDNCDQAAIDYANGLVWSEIECSDQSIEYHNYIDTVNGIDVYYDFGADYYFFTDAK